MDRCERSTELPLALKFPEYKFARKKQERSKKEARKKQERNKNETRKKQE